MARHRLQATEDSARDRTRWIMQASETQRTGMQEERHSEVDSRSGRMYEVHRSSVDPPTTSGPPEAARATPWLTVSEAADRARCGVKLIYREVRARRLRAARVGGRRELRLRAEWIDSWLDAYTASSESSAVDG
jgi:excisionase family DNA binding protein